MIKKLLCRLGYHKEIKVFKTRKTKIYEIHCENCKSIIRNGFYFKKGLIK